MEEVGATKCEEMNGMKGEQNVEGEGSEQRPALSYVALKAREIKRGCENGVGRGGPECGGPFLVSSPMTFNM